MANHGVVTYGSTLENAYMKMETVEHFAKIALVTHVIGRQQPLAGEELEKLLLARSKYEGLKATSLPMELSYRQSCGDRGSDMKSSESESKPRRSLSRQR